jgi:hypothetical protein
MNLVNDTEDDIDWSNPAEAILQTISIANIGEIAEFADLESDKDTLVQ